MSASSFSSLRLDASLVENLESLGYQAMRPVQAACLPTVLQGQDVVVQAATGSGKTVAFGLGVLAHWQPALQVQGLVICPTRELADQVSGQLRLLARRIANVKVLTLCGGAPFGAQKTSLQAGVHLVVGTPGRLLEHLRKETLCLDHLRVLVLDEADRMLEMGFDEQIADVVRQAPTERQTLMFSATFPPSVVASAERHLRNAKTIVVQQAEEAVATGSGSVSTARGSVTQTWCRVPQHSRVDALCHWLASVRPKSCLVFCNERAQCDEVSEHLARLGWAAAPLHSQVVQQDRTHILRLFANGSCQVLVCTDVAARGWDIAALSAVVNLGLPNNPDTYVHRIGRTGRAEHDGEVLNLVSPSDLGRAETIEHALGQPLDWQPPAKVPLAAMTPPRPEMSTLLVLAGKDKKLRPGDLLGALTAEGSACPGVRGDQVGSIVVEERYTYVAVQRGVAKQALARLVEGPVKKRKLKARLAGLKFRAGR